MKVGIRRLVATLPLVMELLEWSCCKARRIMDFSSTPFHRAQGRKGRRRSSHFGWGKITMQWFYNLKIAHKLQLAFGVCLLLAAIAGLVGAQKLTQINRLTRSIVSAP